MRAMGVDVKLPPSKSGSPTAKSHVLITDDGQRQCKLTWERAQN